jgi:hypothetical protein
MTFKTQMASDVTAVFFNTDEFAESARVWDGTTSVPTTVIPGADEVYNGPSAWPLGESQGQSYHLKRSDVPTPRKGMEIEIISTAEFWTVQDFRPSGSDIWVVNCVRAVRARA